MCWGVGEVRGEGWGRALGCKGRCGEVWGKTWVEMGESVLGCGGRGGILRCWER